MITAWDLEPIELLATLGEGDRESLSQKAADLHVAAEEYLVHEGEPPYFFILLSGSLTAYKSHFGRIRAVQTLGPGSFFGEVPIMLGTRQVITIKTNVESRLARLEIPTFYELLRTNPQFQARIKASLTERMALTCRAYKTMAATRVSIVGPARSVETREISHFLSMNRIAYERIDLPQDTDVQSLPNASAHHPTLVVDGTPLITQSPTVQTVATALGMRTAPSKSSYDVVVIGGGPAGLAASVYGASEGLNLLLVERFAPGGQAGTSTRIENYLGFPEGVSGDDLAERAMRQAQRLGAEIVVTRKVTRISRTGNEQYCCELDDGRESVMTKAIILATGVSWRCFNAEGVGRLRGRGVFYGASKTEAGSIIGKDVFVVGGGNSAGQAALYFANYANTVTMLVRSDGLHNTMSQYLISQISAKGNISVEPFTQVISVQGDDVLVSITTGTKPSPDANVVRRDRKADALFILIGADANTGWLPLELARDENGFVLTGQDMATPGLWNEFREPFQLETNLPGVFCAGDVRHGSIKRVSAGVSEGGAAITFVHDYLSSSSASIGVSPATPFQENIA